MKWSRRSHKEAAIRAAEAARLRMLAEGAEDDAYRKVRVPLAKLRKENHVVEDIVRMVRRAPG